MEEPATYTLWTSNAMNTSNELSRDERAILVGIVEELESVLQHGTPAGYGNAREKIRHLDAHDGLIKPNYSTWLGYSCDEPAVRMRCSRMVAKLETLGFVRRVSEGTSARMTHLAIEDRGRMLVDELRREAASGE